MILVQDLLNELSILYSVPLSNIIIGGFSQGAILSIDVGLKMKIGGIIAWSAGMLNGKEWKSLIGKNSAINVCFLHDHVTIFFSL